MSETGASKRPRKEVNYAAMDSLDISDDDEFSGFSSPASRPLHHKPPKDSSKNEKSNLQKKRKLSKLRHVADELKKDSEAPPTSETEDSNIAPARSAPRPRPALHEKLFQRDIEAALELSRQCAGIVTPEENKNENLPGIRFSPPRPLHPPSAAGITPVTVPVEVHGPKAPSVHPSLVCRKGNTDVRILPVAAPQEDGAIDQLVLENSLSGSHATEAKGDGLNRSSEYDDADSTLLVNRSKNTVKRKSCVIESDDDDDFSTATLPNGVTSTLVGATKIIIRSDPEKLSPLLFAKPKTTENEGTATSPKVREASRGFDASSSDYDMKGRQLATPQPEADLPTSGRGKRVRRAVSFLPEPDSESEDEWAEPDELDEDDLSVSEGSDFEPSPKKNKKNDTSNKKKVPPSKTPKTDKLSRETLKRSSATPTNSNPSTISSAATTPKADLKSLAAHTPSLVTLTSKISKTANPCSFIKNCTTPSVTSLATKIKSEFLVGNGDRATPSLPVTAPVLSKVGSISVPPRAGLARAAFKCPVMNGAPHKVSPATRGRAISIPTGTLRLGLSRKSSFKPLHPNATV